MSHLYFAAVVKPNAQTDYKTEQNNGDHNDCDHHGDVKSASTSRVTWESLVNLLQEGDQSKVGTVAGGVSGVGL